jgi:glycosidase
MSFETPDWAKKAVWYQIFPERFRNGDPNNDPPRTVPWTHRWFEPYGGGKIQPPAQDFVEEGPFHRFIYDRRYGGDLEGIRQRLPYLRDLGVTALYLNPVFSAESLHKYDTSDYRHIDDSFGVKDSLKHIQGETADPATWQWSQSDRTFLDVLKEAHRLGFKVIIDGVFNHVGRNFWAFKDVVQNGKNSPYADWFQITNWEPFQYAAWDGENGRLPKLKHDEARGLIEPARAHLFAVTRRWMDPDGDPADGIDGWRLDVAGDINANFWRDWRKLVKSINPEAYLVAELWEESRQWLDGQTFDAVMNYPFARTCQRFFVNQNKRIRPTEFDRQLREILGWYPPQANYVQQNLLDSHDTDRAASMFMNPDLEYDKANRLQDNGPNYNPARPTPDCYEKLRLEAMFQMCFLGAPMVYYGDEVGMYGADDPSSRKPMYWEDLMPYDNPDERIVPGLRDWYRRLIAIRNTCPPLQLGSFETLLAKDSHRIYAFARTLDDQTVVVVLNNSDRPHKLDVPSPWPTDARIVRLDDPQACEVVDPPENAPQARPTIRLIEPLAPPAGSPGSRKPVGSGSAKIVDGHLRGLTLPPRTGAIFCPAALLHKQA